MPVLALATAATLALTSCGSGGSDLLPGSTASEINANLDQVQQLVSEGECIGAENAAGEVSAQVEELSGVDAKLKEALSQGAQRLNEVVSNCQEAPSEGEELEALEEEREAEEAETEKKAKKEKPAKEKPEKEAKEEGETENSLPPQAKGKGKGHEETVPPAEEEPETEAPSGGVGPGTPAGEE